MLTCANRRRRAFIRPRIALLDTRPDDRPCLLLPVFNDWDAVRLLVNSLDTVLTSAGVRADVLVVDDASTMPRPDAFGQQTFASIRTLSVLRLRRNLGHQRAIAIGLTWLYTNSTCRTFIVMDGDGEDDPTDVPRLLDAFRATGGAHIVFAERRRRSESIRFRVGYAIYRWLHVLLTGRQVRVGNFSVLPRQALDALVVVSELWSHYAAAVLKARLPYSTVPTARARRLAGTPSMNVTALVVHGLSAMSVYSDTIGIRLLAGAGVLAMLAAAVGMATFWGLLPPATFWSRAAGVVVPVGLNTVALALIFSITVLLARQNFGFIPQRDYHWFVSDVTEVCSPTEP